MTTEKILNTRVQLKYDSYENWIATANQFKLRPGEVAVVNINGANGANLNNGVENTVVQPTILFKVGIGNPADDATWKTFNQLPWASALAADVHTWAKKSETEFTNWVKTLVTVKDIDLSDYYTKKETDTKLSGKVDVVTGKGLSTNDLTNDLKQKYDTAYAHSQTAHAPANAQENVIEEIKVNGTKVNPVGKSVDISIPTGALAGKDKVAKADLADALATEIDSKVASVGAGNASVTVGGTDTAPTVAVKLSAGTDNAITLEDDGLKVVIPAADTYSIVKDANSGNFAAVYHLAKNGTPITGSTINIPKDMVVDSGEVVTNPDGQPAGTYIKLVLQNVAEPLYINVGDLIEYVTSGSADDDMVVIDVSDDHKVTATISEKSITDDKLAETYTKKSEFNELFREGADLMVNLADFANTADIAHRDSENRKIVDTYKVKQTAVADPTANGETLTFIDTITQNEEGVISATKKNVKLGDYALKEHTHDIEELTQKEDTYIVFDCGSATKNI